LWLRSLFDWQFGLVKTVASLVILVSVLHSAEIAYYIKICGSCDVVAAESGSVAPHYER
jgi:hypothetical protein